MSHLPYPVQPGSEMPPVDPEERDRQQNMSSYPPYPGAGAGAGPQPQQPLYPNLPEGNAGAGYPQVRVRCSVGLLPEREERQWHPCSDPS